MNESFLPAIITACWLGILTSISPCPMATNITAITFIGRQVDRPGYVILTGFLYTLGRTIAYVVLGMLIVASVMAISDVSFFLQEHMNKFIGPILILVGLYLVGLFNLKISGPTYGQRLQTKIEKFGLWGAAVLGILFALSFCPISAALFFGSLIPIAIEHQSRILMPTVYGIGTALPVVVFAFFIALGTRFVGSVFNKLTIFEKWARRITGVVFIVIGGYFVLTYIFGINF